MGFSSSLSRMTLNLHGCPPIHGKKGSPPGGGPWRKSGPCAATQMALDALGNWELWTHCLVIPSAIMTRRPLPNMKHSEHFHVLKGYCRITTRGKVRFSVGGTRGREEKLAALRQDKQSVVQHASNAASRLGNVGIKLKEALLSVLTL